MTKCSVIIPVHNRVGLTARCLDAVLAEPDQAIGEIIVVDDASTDATPDMLAERAADVRVVRHQRNAGFATSCNDGVAAATCDWVALLNNDTIPLRGWLDAVVRYALAREQVGVAGSKLLFPDGTVQHAGVVFRSDLTPQHIYLGFPADHPVVTKSREFQAVTGASLLVRRALFQELGGFDAAFVNGYEDIDFCLRLRNGGYEVHYCHESVLYHFESATRGFASNSLSHKRFLERWGNSVRQDDVAYYVEDGLIDVTYPGQFPAVIRVSPRLAILQWERQNAAERLLAERSRQVYETLKENTRLKVELLEARNDTSNDPGHSPRISR
jgi:GT2 family glycosyltransferase